MTARLKREWGDVPQEEYTQEKMESLRVYYETKKDTSSDVDDITWHDLDMNQIYMTLNNTSCAIGEEYLYSLLRRPCFDKNMLDERKRLIEYFQKNAKERLEVHVITSYSIHYTKLYEDDHYNRRFH